MKETSDRLRKHPEIVLSKHFHRRIAKLPKDFLEDGLDIENARHYIPSATFDRSEDMISNVSKGHSQITSSPFQQLCF